jgi:hypothetical protein
MGGSGSLISSFCVLGWPSDPKNRKITFITINDLIWSSKFVLYSSAKCLVTWEKVCTPKEDGRLGIRCLDTQNTCLDETAASVDHPIESSWVAWTKEQVDIAVTLHPLLYQRYLLLTAL